MRTRPCRHPTGAREEPAGRRPDNEVGQGLVPALCVSLELRDSPPHGQAALIHSGLPVPSLHLLPRPDLGELSSAASAPPQKPLWLFLSSS